MFIFEISKRPNYLFWTILPSHDFIFDQNRTVKMVQFNFSKELFSVYKWVKSRTFFRKFKIISSLYHSGFSFIASLAFTWKKRRYQAPHLKFLRAKWLCFLGCVLFRPENEAANTFASLASYKYAISLPYFFLTWNWMEIIWSNRESTKM